MGLSFSTFMQIVHGTVRSNPYPLKAGGFMPVIEYQPGCRDDEWWPLVTWDTLSLPTEQDARDLAQRCMDELRASKETCKEGSETPPD